MSQQSNRPEDSSPSDSVNTPESLYEQKLAQAEREGLGMKWYTFVVYVQCFFGGFFEAIAGLTKLTGLQYGNEASIVYGYISGLQALDIFFGLLDVVIGGLLIYVRFGLKKFKASAVKLYLGIPIISTMSTLLYNAMAISMISGTSSGSSGVSSVAIRTIISSAIFFGLNYSYFKKRESLFNEA